MSHPEDAQTAPCNSIAFDTNAGTFSGPSFNIRVNGKALQPEQITPQNIIPLVAVYLKGTMYGINLPITKRDMYNLPKHIVADQELLRVIRKTQKDELVIQSYKHLFEQGDYLRWLRKIVPNDIQALEKIYQRFEKVYDSINPHYRIDKDGDLKRMWQN